MTKTNDDIHVNKKYKDTVFRKLFGENGENALSLYNAVNHTSYTDPDDLEYTTLEDVIYMKYKNDVSFLIDKTLSLYIRVLITRICRSGDFCIMRICTGN